MVDFSKNSHTVPLFLVAVLFIGILVIQRGFAWTNPGSVPPTGNSLIRTSNGNVGIGITPTTAKLEINGQIKILGGVPGPGKVLTSDGTGLATWQALPGVTYSP